ncbi:MAG: lytic transglycosylase domain-containing protein [Candidatus Hydrogenedentota bacterium]
MRFIRRLLLFSFIALAVAIFLLGDRIGDIAEDEFSRRYFQKEIRAAADSTALDPLFITSLVYVESKFRPRAVSPQGAVGLMQLLPGTARQVARTHRVRLKDTDALFDPRVNILLGALYMRTMLRDFRDTNLAVAAYNGGPRAVRIWLRSPAARDSDVSGFDKGETKRYVLAVDRTYAQLKMARNIWRWTREYILWFETGDVTFEI